MQSLDSADPAHDMLHFRRVVALAKQLGRIESADLNVIVPAAWLHDLVNVRKDDPRRSQASRLSAIEAGNFLSQIDFPSHLVPKVCHAIESHSFSAQIVAESLEAKVVQDADRLDGLGAIGIARCFATAGLLRRPFYSQLDPFCQERLADDALFTVDHFYKKLFKTVQTLQTSSGRVEGQRRIEIMKRYLSDLEHEIGGLHDTKL